MVTQITEPVQTGEFLLSFADAVTCIDEVTMATGVGTLPAGRVLGRLTASGLLTSYNNGAADGSETAVGILLGRVDTTNAGQPGAMVARTAKVHDRLLDWDGQAQPDIDAGKTDLRTLGIEVV